MISSITKEKVLTSFWVLASAIPLLAALYSSSKPAIDAFLASQTVVSKTNLFEQREAPILSTKRKIQRHYLDYGIYIPIDDIILDLEEGDQISQSKMLRKVCGEGNAYVWVPLRFRLPLIGEKVFEWCLTMN